MKPAYVRLFLESDEYGREYFKQDTPEEFTTLWRNAQEVTREDGIVRRAGFEFSREEFDGD